MRIDRGGALAIAALVASSWGMLGGCAGDDPNLTATGTPDGGADGPAGLTCAPTQNACGGKCVEGNDLKACGAACAVCTAPANGVTTCDGTCKTSCNAGFSACGTECRDLKTDANNCGRCGRVCGTACNDGQCAPTKVVDNLTDPLDLAVGVANVFVRTGSSAPLVQATKGGGSTPTNVFDPTGWTITAGPSLDDINLYFLGTNPGAETRVFKRGISSVLGSTPIASVASCGLGCGLTVLGDTYAWFDPYNLHTCKGACATVYDQPTGGQLQSLALTTTYAVWTNSTTIGSVFRCTLPECAMPTRVTLFESAVDTAPTLIRVHKDIVYWLDNFIAPGDKARVLSCPIGGCGGVPKVIAKGENEMKGLAVDDSGVYFTVEGDTANLAGVVKVCRDLGAGCGVGSEILADKQAQSGPIVLDATHAYWLNKGVSGGPAGTVAANVSRVAK